jgi:hypothetical protein
MFAPAFFHWKVGAVPPFVGVAVNVTLVPVHIVWLPVVIAVATEGVNVALTTIVMPVLVAVVGETHISALGVITQVIASVFANEVLV